MNVFDRVIEAVAPTWGLKRASSRAALQLTRSYAAATNNRRTRGWRTDGRSSRAETEFSLAIMRQRARSLVQDNPFASAALDKLTSYQVGTGIIPRSATGDAARDKLADEIWAEWAANCDWHRKQDVYGLQSLAARCRVESGEVLLQWMPLFDDQARARGMRVPLALVVKEPDFLDDTRLLGTRRSVAGGYIDQGLEFDQDDNVTAYWLFDHHPGDTNILGGSALEPIRVDARQVMHVYRPLRPGQIRGVTEFSSVMLRLRMLDDLEDAALEAARVQACLAAFVTSDAAGTKGPLSGADDGSGEKRLTFRPGMIERLRSGEDVKFVTPAGNDGFAGTAKHQLHAIAEGLGLTYDMLTGDLSSANYSSLRAGRLVFKRRLETIQWGCLIPQCCQPMWDMVIGMAQALGYLPPSNGPWPVRWSPPRFEMLDPGAEMKAVREGIRDGLITWPHAVSEMGWDPTDQLNEIAETNAKFDAAGIILDIDPRRVAGTTGGAQDAAQNAVVELSAKAN